MPRPPQFEQDRDRGAVLKTTRVATAAPSNDGDEQEGPEPAPAGDEEQDGRETSRAPVR